MRGKGGSQLGDVPPAVPMVPTRPVSLHEDGSRHRGVPPSSSSSSSTSARPLRAADDEESGARHDAQQASDADADAEALAKRRQVRLREVVVYFVFLAVWVSMTVLARGTAEAYYLVDRMKAGLFTGEFEQNQGLAFENVLTFSNIYEYVDTIYLPFLLQDTIDSNVTGVSGDTLPVSGRYFPNQHNKLLGAVRMRQVRVEDFSCGVYGGYRFDRLAFDIEQCFDEFRDHEEDRKPIPGCDGADFAAAGASSDPCAWRSSAENGEAVEWIGQRATYPGSGYVMDLPLNLTEAKAHVQLLRNNLWIQDGARAVFLDFNVYNPGVNLHAACRIAFEIGGSGGVQARYDFAALKLNRYFRASGRAQLGLEIIFLAFLFYFVAVELLEARQARRDYAWAVARGTQPAAKRCGWFCSYYFYSAWKYVDWVNLLLFFTSVFVRVASLAQLPEDDPVRHQGGFSSLQTLVTLYRAESYISAFNAFLLWMKVFKYFGVHPRIAFLYRTFKTASVDLIFFFVVFFVFFLAFAHSGYLSFSGDTEDFRSFIVSIVTMFRAVAGDLDYNALESSNRFVGPLYYIVFQIFVILILVNVFLAILTEAYARVHEQDEQNEKDNDLKATSFFAAIFGRSKTNKDIKRRITQLGADGALDGQQREPSAGARAGARDRRSTTGLRRNETALKEAHDRAVLAALEKALHDADADGNNRVTARELERTLLAQRVVDTLEEAHTVARNAIAAFDVNKSGFLGPDEIRKVEHMIAQQKGMSHAQRQRLNSMQMAGASRGAAIAAAAAADMGDFEERLERIEAMMAAIVAHLGVQVPEVEMEE